MPIIGNAITNNDVVSDPRWSSYKPDEVPVAILSEYTMEQKVKFDLDATKIINGIKEEYGTGVSSLIRIYNASGRTLNFVKQGDDWHGHMYKYPPDNVILNGQWSVFLHVKTAGAATGSESCVIYSIDSENSDVLFGWMVPWNQSQWSPKVYIDIGADNKWTGQESWSKVQSKIEHSSSHCTASFMGPNNLKFNGSADIGNDTSPIVNYVLSAEGDKFQGKV